MRKLTALLLTAAFLVCAAPQSIAAVGVKLGDYLEMGDYYGESIIWRCVAVDSNGPLMLCDKVICFKAFDAAGSETEGSHGRHLYNSKSYRESYGSNYWADSDIRAWLNSASDTVVWTCKNAPDAEHVLSGNNAYSRERGFLTAFTAKARSAIKSVEQRSVLSRSEYADMSSYGSAYHAFNNTIAKAVQNYADAYSESVTDKMFLLDVKQLYSVYQNRAALGDTYYAAYPTAAAVEKSQYKSADLSQDLVCPYWLRTPTASAVQGTAVRYAENEAVKDIAAYNGAIGIRPAFYLDTQKAVFGSGTGSAALPYVIEGSGKPKMEITSSEYNEGTVNVRANIRMGDREKAYVAFATYDKAGALTGLRSMTLSEDAAAQYSVAADDTTTTVKGFMWDKSTLAPLPYGKGAQCKIDSKADITTSYISFDTVGDIGKYTVSGSVSLVNGLVGKAARFDGNASNYITVASAKGNDILAAKDAATVSFFFKSEGELWPFFAAPTTAAITYQDEYYVGILDRIGTLDYERYAGGRNNAEKSSNRGGIACSANTWHHMALVLDGNSSKMYIDGTLAMDLPSPSTLKTIFPTTSYVYLGHANWNSGESYIGCIDEFKSFNKALSAQEIAQIAHEYL